MGSKAALVQPATPADTQDIAELQMEAFCSEYFDELFPAKGGLGLRYYIAAWRSFIVESQKASSGIRPVIHIIRGEDGKLLSTALYYIIPPGFTSKDLASWRARWGTPLPGMNDAKVAEFFESMAAQHDTVMADQPHFYLEVIMSHSTVRRQGYGLALLENGNKMADKLKLASYLDSEQDAKKFYENVGYVYQKDAQTQSPMLPMLRPAVST